LARHIEQQQQQQHTVTQKGGPHRIIEKLLFSALSRGRGGGEALNGEEDEDEEAEAVAVRRPPDHAVDDRHRLRLCGQGLIRGKLIRGRGFKVEAGKMEKGLVLHGKSINCESRKSGLGSDLSSYIAGKIIIYYVLVIWRYK
jgi:hypothetical protein